MISMGGVNADASWGGSGPGSREAAIAGTASIGGDVGAASSLGSGAASAAAASTPSNSSYSDYIAREVAAREAQAIANNPTGAVVGMSTSASEGERPTVVATAPTQGVISTTRTDPYARELMSLPASERAAFVARSEDPKAGVDIGVPGNFGTGKQGTDVSQQYLNRPDVYQVTDPKQIALMATGLTAYQAAEKLRYDVSTPGQPGYTPSVADDLYYETLRTQAWTTRTGESAGYHTWAQKSGLPQAANPFEYTADLMTYAEKGYPTQRKDVFSPVNYEMLGLAEGKGAQAYSTLAEQQYDLRGAADVIARAERSGDMGPYGQLRSWSSYGGELGLGEQQSIAIKAAERRGEPYSLDSWGATPQALGRLGEFVPIVQPQAKQDSNVFGGSLSLPAPFISKSDALEPLSLPAPFLSKSSAPEIRRQESTQPDIVNTALRGFFGLSTPEEKASFVDLVAKRSVAVPFIGTTAFAAGGFGTGASTVGIGSTLASNPIGWGVAIGGASVFALEKTGGLGLFGPTEGMSVRSLGAAYGSMWNRIPGASTPLGQQPRVKELPMSAMFNAPEIVPKEQSMIEVYPASIPTREITPKQQSGIEVFPAPLVSSELPAQQRSIVELITNPTKPTTSNKNTVADTYANKLRQEYDNTSRTPNRNIIQEGFGFPPVSPTSNPNRNIINNPFETPFKNPFNTPTRNPTSTPTQTPYQFPTQYPNPTTPGQPQPKPRIDIKVPTIPLPNFNFGGGGSTGGGGRGRSWKSRREFIPLRSNLDFSFEGFGGIPPPRRKNRSIRRFI